MNEYLIPISVLGAILLSSITKEIIHVLRNGTWSWYTFFIETGGMPSTHSAAVSALTTSIFFTQGASPLFWASLVFSAVIVRDAFGVRKSVSDQATVLNTLLDRHEDYQHKVDVILGHTPLQAVIGVVLGVGLTCILGLWPY